MTYLPQPLFCHRYPVAESPWKYAYLNVSRRTKEKIDKYGSLIRNMQMLYGEYKFSMVPIIIGCLGYVSKDLSNYLNEIGLEKNLIRKLESLTVSGTVKIVKSFLGFNI